MAMKDIGNSQVRQRRQGEMWVASTGLFMRHVSVGAWDLAKDDSNHCYFFML